jgi:hypothetical protein
MNQVIVDPDLRARLQGLEQQTAFCDESGQPLGLFLPLAEYRKLLATVQIPLSEEEIERRKRETGGSSLEEFWRRAGRIAC